MIPVFVVVVVVVDDVEDHGKIHFSRALNDLLEKGWGSHPILKS